MSSGVQDAFARYAAETRAGMAYVWRRTGLSAVLGIFAGVNCLSVPVFVLLPFYTREVLGAGPEWYGFLLSGSGSGALAGSIAASPVLRRVRARAAWVRGCIAGVAAGVLLPAVSTTAWLALAAFAAIGARSSLMNVIVITAFQTTVPADVRGRVMSRLIALRSGAVPLGMALGGALGDLWRESLRLLIAGSGLAIAVLGVVSLKVSGFVAVLEEGDSPKPS